MFSLFKKNVDPEELSRQTDELLKSISKNSDLQKKLNTITTNIVNIQNKRDFVEHFTTYLGSPLSATDFIDVLPTKNFKHKAYKYIFSHHELSEFLDDYSEVIGKLKVLKSRTTSLYSKDILLFHEYDNEIGAIKMTLKKFWSLFPKILNVLGVEANHDLLVVATNFSFGFCIEIEGQDYSITTWGIEK